MTLSPSPVVSIPTMMKAVVYYAPGDVRYEQVAVPELLAGEALIQIEVATTDGTDLKTYRRGHPVLLGKLPSLFGHECVGRVVALGDGVTTVKVGDRVVPANSAPCDTCYFCKKNQPNLCEELSLLNGTYAQFLKIPERIVSKNMLVIPESVPAPIASCTEPLAVALRGLDACHIKPGDVVAILGLGAVGQLMMAVAKQRGATVVGFGRNPLKRQLAASFAKADSVVDMSDVNVEDLTSLDTSTWLKNLTPNGVGFDVVIEAVGLPQMWEMAVAMVRRGGRVCWFGGCPSGSTVSLDTRRLHYDEITLVSPFHHTPAHFRKACQMLVSGAIDPTPLITDHMPLSDLEVGLTQMADGHALKLAIWPE